MFITRLLSGIVLLAIIIAAGIMGGPVLWCLVTLISLLGVFEIYRMFQLHKTAFGSAGFVLCLVLDGVLLFDRPQMAEAVLVVALLLFMVIYVVTYPKYSVKEVCLAYTGFVYTAVLLSFLYRIRMEDGGILLYWMVFVGAWGSDTCAYCIGCLLGKHKAFPKLSPKKSVEGCIGGVVGAAMISGIYAVSISRFAGETEVSVVWFAIMGAAASLVSQIGDLAASAMKRNYERKDYGTLIPGHGGILDRFDSIIFTAPLIYYLSRFITM